MPSIHRRLLFVCFIYSFYLFGTFTFGPCRGKTLALDKLPVLHHYLGDTLERMALKVDVGVLDEGHDELLRPQTLGDGPAVGVITDELTDIVAGDAGHLLVIAREEGDEDLQEAEVTVGSLHHPRVLLEEGLSVGGPPL